ncbi:hypothetical protein [Shewanella putrefaciens]|nr:hypothetical protein [Shewanella putrefaciens]
MKVVVGGMVAYSHPCDRDISMSYTADAAIEPSWTDYFKTKVGVSQE